MTSNQPTQYRVLVDGLRYPDPADEPSVRAAGGLTAFAAQVSAEVFAAVLVGGYVGSVVAQPTGDDIISNPVVITDTSATALDVSGGAQFGSGDVALVGTDGKLNGPLSSTILDDLSGANLTTLDAGNISTGTLASARGGVPANQNAGSVSGTNAPYVQLLACQKQ